MYAVEANYLPTPLKLTYKEVYDPCSCISYAKALTGHTDEIWGNAKQLEADSDIPWIGYLVLLDEGPYGHVAVIKGIEGDKLLLTEANYIQCEVSERTISIFDTRIKGFRIP